MITIAGSGPSAKGYDHVTVATKKRSVPSDYIFTRFLHNYSRYKRKGDDTPLMLYCGRCTCGKCDECRVPVYRCDHYRWNRYFKDFVRLARPPQRTKPSSGLCAVFGVVERWAPETIGLIGFDWILDGNPKWEHDAVAERNAILSLVNVKDLRNDQVIRRVRSA